jgi:hypothetical protein
MTGPSNSTANRRFPSGLGATAAWRLSDGRKLTLFVVDQSIPLYNVVIGKLRFFADSGQVSAYVAHLDATPAEDPTMPQWKWVFESGFDQSVDGSRNKRWCLTDR